MPDEKILSVRKEIVDFARTLLGTPFKHLGRDKDDGIDCIGLLVLTARHLSLSDADLGWYDMNPDGHTLVEELDKALVTIDLQDAVPGDVCVFRIQRSPQHVGILTPYRYGGMAMIHTWYSTAGVVEHRIDERWHKRIRKAYAFPGMENVPWLP